MVKFVQTGQGLVMGAQASLTNPKVVTHLGLIKDGLGNSISVIAASGELVLKLTADLGSFATSGSTTRTEKGA
jgi:hypothetical protein